MLSCLISECDWHRVPSRLAFSFRLGFTLIGAGLLAGCSQEPSPTFYEPPSGGVDQLLTVSNLTDRPVRVVWVADQTGGKNWEAIVDGSVLMRWDSRVGEASVIDSGRGHYYKPLIAPGGDEVVFSDYRSGEVFRVPFEGGEMVKIGEGVAADLWRDPETGETWVYALRGKIDHRSNFRELVRFRLSGEGPVEILREEPVNTHNFQLSFDGHRASGQFPWPEAGMLNLETGELSVFRKGCWASMSPDNSYRFWIFDGDHRRVHFYGGDDYGKRWEVSLSTIPGLEGDRVYYPRWTNHPLFFVVSAPMNQGAYSEADLFLGRLSRDNGEVEAWAPLVATETGDFMPDVWIDGAESGNFEMAVEPAGKGGLDSAAPPQERVKVQGRLVERSPVPSPGDIRPYRKALAVYRYEVAGSESPLESDEILVAHWVIRDSKILPAASWETGSLRELTLVPFDGHPTTEGQRLISGIHRPDLGLWLDVPGTAASGGKGAAVRDAGE